MFLPALLFTLATAILSASAVPLVPDTGCNLAEGEGHYVTLKPHDWTVVNSRDKIGDDNWSLLGGFEQSPRWYFTTRSVDGRPPYVVEHFDLYTYARDESRGWWAVSQDFEPRVALHQYECWVRAPYGISPQCLSIHIYDEASGQPLISKNTADVTTECVPVF